MFNDTVIATLMIIITIVAVVPFIITVVSLKVIL